MEPYYTYLDVRIRKPATALADLASMVSGRLLVRPMMTERPTVAVLVDGVHKVDSVRRALEKSFSKKIVSDETLVYLADTPSGVWALLRIQDEILSLLLEFPLELDPPAVEIDDQGAAFGVFGPSDQAELLQHKIMGRFRDEASLRIRLLRYPPLYRILGLGDRNFRFDRTDLAVAERCMLDGYFATPRKVRQEDIARKLALSKPEVNRRIRKLEEAGFRAALASFPADPKLSKLLTETYGSNVGRFLEPVADEREERKRLEKVGENS